MVLLHLDLVTVLQRKPSVVHLFGILLLSQDLGIPGGQVVCIRDLDAFLGTASTSTTRMSSKPMPMYVAIAEAKGTEYLISFRSRSPSNRALPRYALVVKLALLEADASFTVFTAASWKR